MFKEILDKLRIVEQQITECSCGCGCSKDNPCDCKADCSCGCNAVKESLEEGAMDDALIDLNIEGEGAIRDIADDYGISPSALAAKWQDYKKVQANKASGQAGARRDDERRSNQQRIEKESILDGKKKLFAAAGQPAEKKRAPYYVMSDGWEQDKQPVSHDEISALGNFMERLVGEIFPDGDPHIVLSSYFRKKGWDPDDAQKLIPIAAEKVLGTSSYTEYLINNWDKIHQDAEDDANHGDSSMLQMMGGRDAENPFRN